MTTISEVLDAADRFEPFFFDSNSRFGLVESPDGLVEFAKAWMRDSGGRSLDEFLEAREAPRRRPGIGHPKYGFRSECTGPGTLREFLEGHEQLQPLIDAFTSGP